MREEDLLAYLLNAVDAAQRRRIEETLERDASLRQQLETLRQRLRLIGSASQEYDPPEGLAEQTCDLVEGCQRQRSCRGRSAQGEGTLALRGWSLSDMAVAAGLCLAIAMLFFPAIANSRYRSHIHICQHNLQQLGVALCQFSNSREGAFPRVPVSGHRAAAGIYAPILIEHELLPDKRLLVCPSSRLAANLADWRVPTLAELDRAQDRRLPRLQAAMGGSYGYTLGYLVGDRYYPPRNESRSFFALMSDAPSLHLAGRRSSNHCGRGQNVLFEDLHVAFIVDEQEPAAVVYHRKALFVNRYGFAEAGVDKNDYVIGGSDTPPLRITRPESKPIE